MSVESDILTVAEEGLRYQEFQEKKERDWEARCRCCGMCCGIKDNDPCEELMVQENGLYTCRAYDKRLGPRRTQSGKMFSCVLIRDILHQSWPGKEQCGYYKD